MLTNYIMIKYFFTYNFLLSYFLPVLLYFVTKYTLIKKYNVVQH